jgi:predicted transposase YdaD
LISERRECVCVTIRANEIVYLILFGGKRDNKVGREGRREKGREKGREEGREEGRREGGRGNRLR